MLAQGNALGFGIGIKSSPERAGQVPIKVDWAALSGLGMLNDLIPRALPWALMDCPFGAPEYGAPEYGVSEYGAPEYAPRRACVQRKTFGASEYGVSEYGVSEYGAPEYAPRRACAQRKTFGAPEYGVSECGVPECGVSEYGAPEYFSFSSPVGAGKSVPYVAFIKGDAMPFQKNPVFLLK